MIELHVFLYGLGQPLRVTFNNPDEALKLFDSITPRKEGDHEIPVLENGVMTIHKFSGEDVVKVEVTKPDPTYETAQDNLERFIQGG